VVYVGFVMFQKFYNCSLGRFCTSLYISRSGRLKLSLMLVTDQLVVVVDRLDRIVVSNTSHFLLVILHDLLSLIMPA